MGCSNNITRLDFLECTDNIVDLKDIGITKNEKTMKLTKKGAKEIIKVACNEWKNKLAELWGAELLLNNEVNITKNFYNKMIDASDESQKEVINKYLKFEDKIKLGDRVKVVSGGYGAYGADSIEGFVVDKPSEENKSLGGHYEEALIFVLNINNGKIWGLPEGYKLTKIN